MVGTALGIVSCGLNIDTESREHEGFCAVLLYIYTHTYVYRFISNATCIAFSVSVQKQEGKMSTAPVVHGLLLSV